MAHSPLVEASGGQKKDASNQSVKLGPEVLPLDTDTGHGLHREREVIMHLASCFLPSPQGAPVNVYRWVTSTLTVSKNFSCG